MSLRLRRSTPNVAPAMVPVDDVRRWLWCDPAAAPPERPAEILYEVAADHCDAIRRDQGPVSAHVLLRHPQGPQIYPRRADVPSPCTVFDLLLRGQNVLVVGGRSTGKTELMAHVAAQSLSLEPAWVPFPVPVRLLTERLLDERTIAELCPIGALRLVREATAQGRALVLVDGLDEAGASARPLSESIETFAAAHPGVRIVVTTRPRRTGIPGFARVELRGFTTAALLPPQGSRLYSAHRFLERRAPEQRAPLIAAEVEARLRASAPAGPTPGAPGGPDGSSDAVLARFDIDDRRALFGLLAHSMHEQGIAEIPEDLLLTMLKLHLHGVRRTAGGSRLLLDRTDELDDHITDEEIAAMPREGELVDDVADLAARIVREIKERPALLVQRSPGVFAFADLIYQAHLTAKDAIRIRRLDELIDQREDPWWLDVLVLAASAPEHDPVGLIQGLLESENAATATLVAARCAEATASRLPEPLLRTIQRRLTALVPPDSEPHLAHLIDLGELVVPALLKVLPAATPNQRAYSTIVLGALSDYRACPTLVRLAADEARTEGAILTRIWKSDVVLRRRPVAHFALAALLNLAIQSAQGRAPFEQALQRCHLPSLKRIHDWVDHDYMTLEKADRDAEVVRALLVAMEKALRRLAAASPRKPPPPPPPRLRRR